jgi:PAS domain S-box-containing protein
MPNYNKIPVLIVDDRPENLISLEALLCDMELDLVKASSGNEALIHALHTDFALVLLDVQMPEMDGFETAELLRKHPKTQQLPIILVTAGMMEENHVFKGYEAGVVDYLMKPIEPGILRSKVRVFCELFLQRRELKKYEQHLEALVAERTADLSITAEQLLQSNGHYQRLLESIISYVYTVTVENGQPSKMAHNAACQSVTGYSCENYQSDPNLWYRIINPDDRQMVFSASEKLLAEKMPVTIEYRILHKDKSQRWIMNTMVPSQVGDSTLFTYDGIVVDITDRKRLEEQLVQSQKMESIGRLAGGVAHDFNNMLSVILGSSELLKLNIPELAPDRTYLDLIIKAAQRSSEITRQLLTFSRKEIISPKPVNLNALVFESEKLLRPLICEDIKLSFHRTTNLWTVKIDPLQLDQILMNLAVNSRDAMPKGGSLKIAMANIRLNGDCSHYHLDAKPGDYVKVSVSDTGFGMERDMVDHIFEPFFTTKGVNKGTGLGLSTVYGIVTQNNGFIHVISEPWQGTTFEIYLPRTLEAVVGEMISTPAPFCGSGTILLVEDEGMLLVVAAKQLEEAGYTVIKAATPQEAMYIFERKDQQIDLVLTDVVMPGINGKELVERMKVIRPALKVLFMSGYTADIVAQRGVLEEGMHYIQKPFDVEVLQAKIRQVLSERDSAWESDPPSAQRTGPLKGVTLPFRKLGMPAGHG